MPFLLGDAKSGLYLQWNKKARVSVNETALFVASDHFVNTLRQGLINSRWHPPPSFFVSQSGPSVEISLNHLSLKSLRQAWHHSVMHFYGSEVVKLGLRIFGTALKLSHLAKIKANQSNLLARLQEHPNLAPLLTLAIEQWPYLENWRPIKMRLLTMGLTQSSWRWLTHTSGAYAALIDWHQLSHIAWVNIHALLGRSSIHRILDQQLACIAGFSSFTNWVRRENAVQMSYKLCQFLRVIRICIDHYDVTQDIDNRQYLCGEEFPLIADWLMAAVSNLKQKPLQVARNWNYATLMNKQANWHLFEWVTKESRINMSWSQKIGDGYLCDNTFYLELNTYAALLQEAKQMHHCVPTYLERCMAGEVVLFHIQKNQGKRERATVEFTLIQPNYWKVTQIKGPCNSPVSTELKQVANTLLKKMPVIRFY